MGGLIVATVVTLFIVPVIYSLLRKNAPARNKLDEQFELETMRYDEVEGAHTVLVPQPSVTTPEQH